MHVVRKQSLDIMWRSTENRKVSAFDTKFSFLGPFNPLSYAGGEIPGATGKFLATWATLINAAFAFNNVQIVSMAGAETINPRVSIPTATRRTFIRLSVFYIATLFVMGLIVPSNSPSLGASSGTAATAPFVIAIKAAGIKILPGIVNAVVMTSAFSSVSGVACKCLNKRGLFPHHIVALFLGCILRLQCLSYPRWSRQ